MPPGARGQDSGSVGADLVQFYQRILMRVSVCGVVSSVCQQTEGIRKL